MDGQIEIFFSYAHEDEDLMNDVRRQLVVHERNGRILKWHDRMIPPGAEWRHQIDWRLEKAEIILLFLSPHFIESRYCYEVEGRVALRRHAAREAHVVPVILRPCFWRDTPYGMFQALPRNGRPVSRWKDRDEACLDVARGVMTLVDEPVLRHSGLTDGLRVLPADSMVRPADESSTSKAASLVYCGRCGQAIGQQSICTGGYTHHEFTTGTAQDYCTRCGVRPGSPSICTGGYTDHAFARGSGAAHCSRCGASVGKQSVCTGGFTHHSFINAAE
jgi:hypothetical protein